jgi:hypothetical protein
VNQKDPSSESRDPVRQNTYVRIYAVLVYVPVPFVKRVRISTVHATPREAWCYPNPYRYGTHTSGAKKSMRLSDSRVRLRPESVYGK